VRTGTGPSEGEQLTENEVFAGRTNLFGESPEIAFSIRPAQARVSLPAHARRVETSGPGSGRGEGRGGSAVRGVEGHPGRRTRTDR
jgi:hypothetical protein